MSRGNRWLTLLGLAAGAAGAFWAAQAYRRARAACPPFRKRMYTSSRQIVAAFAAFWHHPGDLVALRGNRFIDHPLAEKMMLAVVSANGSRHYGYSYARYAMQQGLPPQAVAALLRGDLGPARVDEAPALFFAQHWAEQSAQPDSDMFQQMTETYGAQTAHDLLTYIRVVSFGSLAGNVLDALVSRLLGQPAPETTLRQELLMLAALAFGIAPLVPVLAWRVARLSA